MKPFYKLVLLASIFSIPLSSYSQTNIAPSRASLVDTGYDICMQNGGKNCVNNKNLMFRGNVPLDVDNNYKYDPDFFRGRIFAYIQEFRQAYHTNAKLPDSLEDLKNYRIVMVNLLYDATEQGKQLEYDELAKEFQYSGIKSRSAFPLQHKIYNLTAPFNPDSYAFEWWPLTLLGDDNHDGIPGAINWPQHEIVPVPNTDQNYLPMDLPYLVSGTVYGDDIETEAADLRSLLAAQPEDGHPLLIFFHCFAGRDRTATAALAYLMANGGYANISDSNQETAMTRSGPLNFRDAMAALTHSSYPDPDDAAIQAAKAYCEYSGRPQAECELSVK